MGMVRIAAVLLLIAVVLALVYFWTRNRRYLTWAWRVFLLALACMLGVLGFFVIERIFFVG
jgi:hypothetical protein